MVGHRFHHKCESEQKIGYHFILFFLFSYFIHLIGGWKFSATKNEIFFLKCYSPSPSSTFLAIIENKTKEKFTRIYLYRSIDKCKKKVEWPFWPPTNTKRTIDERRWLQMPIIQCKYNHQKKEWKEKKKKNHRKRDKINESKNCRSHEKTQMVNNSIQTFESQKKK